MLIDDTGTITIKCTRNQTQAPAGPMQLAPAAFFSMESEYLRPKL